MPSNYNAAIIYTELTADNVRKMASDLMTKPESKVSNRVRLDRFLCSVQKSGFRMAQLATSNTDDAMDLVQETMLQLVKRYSDRPDNELKILFYRILSSRITDWYRKTAFRNQFHFIFNTKSHQQNDPIQELSGTNELGIDGQVEQTENMVKLLAALKTLSPRQRQAFLLRAWQGFDGRETASIMKCSTGSVKTHYSRATKTLKALLHE